MSKLPSIFIFIFLSLSLELVSALSCFKSNITKPIDENSSTSFGVVRRVQIDVTHRPQNCEDLREEYDKDTVFSCYKTVFIDLTTRKAGLIKGCFPNKGCDWLTEMVVREVDLPERDIQCYQCDEDRCNAATAPKAILPLVLPFSLLLRALYIRS